MRPSPQRHTLAVLRTIIGLTQKELAAELECSVPTIQAIELGKLKLSEGLAGRVLHQTGVNYHWLMNDDVSVPATTNRDDQPFTKETYQAHRAMQKGEPEDGSDVRRELFRVRAEFRATIERVGVLLYHAYLKQNVSLCSYKLYEALDKILEWQPGYEKLSEEERKSFTELRLFSYSDEDLMAAALHFADQTEKVYQERMQKFAGKPKSGRHPIMAENASNREEKLAKRQQFRDKIAKGKLRD